MPDYQKERLNLEKEGNGLITQLQQAQQVVLQLSQRLAEVKGAIKLIDRLDVEDNPIPKQDAEVTQ